MKKINTEVLGLLILGLTSVRIGFGFHWESSYSPQVLYPGSSLTLRWSYTLTDDERKQANDFSLVIIEKERLIFSNDWQGLAVKIPFSGVYKRFSQSSIDINLIHGQGAGLILLNATGQSITRYRCTFLSGFSVPKQVIMPNVRETIIRLVYGYSPSVGIVEIFHSGQWGKVCGYGWDFKAANVICRMLGYPAAKQSGSYYLNIRNATIWLNGVQCQGTEESITQCVHHPWGVRNCSYNHYAGVFCQTKSEPTPTPYYTTRYPRYTTRRPYFTTGYTANPSPGYNPVRLVGGSSSMGRVEIYYRGEWGTICDDAWDINDARVVCRMLGYPSAYRALREAHFGQGSGRIWLDEVGCMGYERTISHCRHNPWGQNDCSHREDAGVMCTRPTSTTPTSSMSTLPPGSINIRLAGMRNSSFMGRVEIYYRGEWGTICDDGWDINDAHVVCRMLGSGSANKALSRAHFGRGTGRIWLDEVNCFGNESSIAQCSHRPWGLHDCGHNEDAGVICKRKEPSDIQRISPTIHVKRGVNVYLFCSATGSPSPTVKWIRNNRTLVSRISYASYVIYNIHFHNAGIYRCIASNEYGSDSNTTLVYVLQKPMNTLVNFNVSKRAAMIGETVMVTCKTEAYPPAMCVLYRHGNRLATNTSYIIFGITSSDFGPYICSCSNSLGNSNGTGTLTLYEHPFIQTVFPRTQNINETDSLKIFCNATGNPPPNISWYRASINKTLVGFGRILNVLNTSLDDEGTYICTADNGRHQATANATVNLVYRVPRIITPPKNTTIAEDYSRSYYLYCNVTGNPKPNVKWFKVDLLKKIPVGYRENLTLNARWNYSGVYECVAENGIGQAARASAFYQVLHKPYSTQLKTNRDNNVVVGNAAINIICTSIANPPADSYTIYLGNKYLATSSTGLYSITRAKAEDEGTYTCLPRNSIGSGANASTELHVFGALSIVSAPKNTTVLEGRKAMLYCNASSSLYKVHLPPIIRWRKVGAIDKHFPDGKVLTVEDSQPKDTGVYECEARNGIALPDAARATLVVQFKPRDTTIESSTGGNRIFLNTTMSLVCKSTAVPPVSNYVFFLNGIKIKESSSGVLNISRVSSSNEGTYSCVSRNSIGDGPRASITLKLTRCGVRTLGNSGQTRIIGGDDSNHGGWPWQVQMALTYSGTFHSHWCGASILNDKWIVTAAHCVTRRWTTIAFKPESLNITVGEYNRKRIDGTEQKIPVEMIIVHKNYSRFRIDYDIALLKLRRRMIFNDHVSPVCLPKFDFPPNTTCYITGWGRTTMANYESSIVLQEAEVPLMDRTRCKRLLQGIGRVTSRMRCNGYNGYVKSTCHGDSGGPLVCERQGTWYLMGVTSWGARNCADARYPSVYADVLYFKNWILESIKQNS